MHEIVMYLRRKLTPMFSPLGLDLLIADMPVEGLAKRLREVSEMPESELRRELLVLAQELDCR